MAKEVTFEEKLKELEELVEEIEAGEAGLNKSVEKYAQAQKILEELEGMLTKAREASLDS